MQRREWLKLLIQHEFDDSDETYGHRRIHAQLTRWGASCSAELVRSLMRELGEFHEPYLARNEEIVRLIDAGETQAAARVLTGYLTDAESQLTSASRHRLS